MNKVTLTKIKVDNNKIIYCYQLEGKWKKYFNKNKDFEIEYSESINNVPSSILTIPFVSLFLPISWIFDATIEVETLDKNFYNSIRDIKNGYINMYSESNYEFKGDLIVKKIEENIYDFENKAAFFSGGIDATSTCISHIDEKPLLINLQKLPDNKDESKTLKKIEKSLEKLTKKLNLKLFTIETNFKSIIRTRFLDFKINRIFGVSYWYGFQHGLSIISHSAPLVYLKKISSIYIASSNTPEDGKVKCASDPTLDNCVKIAKANIVHDSFELTRDQKIINIAEYMKKNNLKLNLRVCLYENKINNCCKCEKCYRTIAGIEVNGYDARNFGFDVNEQFYKKMEFDMINRIDFSNTKKTWGRIKEKAILNKQNIDNYKWIYDIDFNNDKKIVKKYIIHYINAIIKRIKKFIGVKNEKD